MAELTASEFVTRELFDTQIQSIKDKIEADKKLTDEKFEKFQMILEKNLAEYKTMIIEVNGRIDVLSEKLEHTTDSLTIAILDLDKRIDTMDKRIDDIRQTQNLWFSIFGIIATVVPIAVVVIQSFAK
ncbi:MAG: hypothetical protein IJM82_10065 [Synergistaceae bacterium]|nr:hypothetical protein [Synergistaceae bacterium]MBR0253706.1 hypothetical protein [Synergistaceae bacterium]